MPDTCFSSVEKRQIPTRANLSALRGNKLQSEGSLGKVPLLDIHRVWKRYFPMLTQFLFCSWDVHMEKHNSGVVVIILRGGGDKGKSKVHIWESQKKKKD